MKFYCVDDYRGCLWQQDSSNCLPGFSEHLRLCPAQLHQQSCSPHPQTVAGSVHYEIILLDLYQGEGLIRLVPLEAVVKQGNTEPHPN